MHIYTYKYITNKGYCSYCREWGGLAATLVFVTPIVQSVKSYICKATQFDMQVSGLLESKIEWWYSCFAGIVFHFKIGHTVMARPSKGTAVSRTKSNEFQRPVKTVLVNSRGSLTLGTAQHPPDTHWHCLTLSVSSSVSSTCADV